MDRAVFLDRDGTIIEDLGGSLVRPDEIKVLPNAFSGIKAMRNMGFKMIVITNQSAVGKGKLNEDELQEIHSSMQALFARNDAALDGLYYCPYHPEAALEDYRKVSELRKPAPGMILQAANDFSLDLSQCIFIGDAARDRDAGKAAGCRTIRIASEEDPEADFTARDLVEAADWIRNSLTARA